MPSPSLPVRTRAAALAARSAAGLSRLVGTGGGSVIGGRAALVIDPRALERLGVGHRVALVTGTNGKTTTTRLLATALAAGGPVSSNSAGANLLAGLVAALAQERPGTLVALEVDEALLGTAADALEPEVIVLLNLSRDQLDRAGEVRLHAERWRILLGRHPGVRVVANTDDPLVVWAATEVAVGDRVIWVQTGTRWRADATTCAECGGRIEWDHDGRWACSSCSFARPAPDYVVDDSDVVVPGGSRVALNLSLPGQFNRANATMAAVGATAMGLDFATSLAAMASVGHVAGRYSQVRVGSSRVRLLLAKNPAGWEEMLDLLRPPPVPVVIGINARVPDGRDPSWLWDVDFERLAGRMVVATGDRGRDLAVRLRYAQVGHTFVDGYQAAVAAAVARARAGAALAGLGPAADGTGADGTGADGAGPPIQVDLAANYTSFQDARKELEGNSVRKQGTRHRDSRSTKAQSVPFPVLRSSAVGADPSAVPTDQSGGSRGDPEGGLDESGGVGGRSMSGPEGALNGRGEAAEVAGASRIRSGGSAVAIVVLFPELLGTYGDGGNSVVAAQRLRWRGIDAEIVTVSGGEPVPESADLYLLGGGEDGPQSLAAITLAADGGLGRAVERGAAVLAVCAGFQILGRTFVGPGGGEASGLGLIDCSTTRGVGPRRVGEIVVEAAPHLHLPVLSGYENHGGVTALGSGATPLGTVTVGRGNDGGGGVSREADEGAVCGRIVATYLHGPVLARNPALADMLLSWAVGQELAPLDVAEVDELRRERLAAAVGAGGGGNRGRDSGRPRRYRRRAWPTTRSDMQKGS